MKKIFFPAFILVTVAISCKKSDSAAPATPYMSTTAGNIWTYENTNNSTSPATVTTHTLTSTNRDSAINSRNYHVFTNSSGPNEYYLISGNDYYNFRDFSAFGGANKIEDLYLKDNLNAAGNWVESFTLSVTIPGVPIPVSVPVTVTNTIAEKNISKTVQGTTYTEVIHVKTDITSSLITSGLTTDIHNYYARKYGMISSSTVIHLNFSGVTQDVDTRSELKTTNF